jgi:hypothetical protein
MGKISDRKKKRDKYSKHLSVRKERKKEPAYENNIFTTISVL